MAEEAGDFGFGDIVEAITAKMIRRHPHVFGDAATADAKVVKARWEAIKAEEKRERAGRRGGPSDSLLEDVPVALPALSRALKLQKRAATVGFDWDSVPAVLDKIREEIAECEAEIARDIPDDERLGGEIGDLLFAVANLARHRGVDPEAALSGANAKFRRRFGFIESELRRAGRTPQEAGLDEMEALWRVAKEAEA
jgi:nucleoside triphosphate diphosphatase